MTVKTIAATSSPTTPDYSSLQTWFDDAPSTLTAPWEGQVLDQGEITTGSALTFSGKTATATNFFKLTAAAGASFADKGDADTNPLIYDASKGAAIRSTDTSGANWITINQQWFYVSRLQFANASDNTGYGQRLLNCASGYTFLDQLIVRAASRRGIAMTIANGEPQPSLRNIAIVMTGANGSSVQFAVELYVNSGVPTVPVAVGVTAVLDPACALSGTVGFSQVQQKPIVKDCISVGFATCFTSGGGYAPGLNNYSYCISSDATAPNTGSQTGVAGTSLFTSFASGSIDLRLKSGSPAIGAGVDDATYLPTDIIGTTRTATDIGAVEYGTPAAPEATVFGVSPRGITQDGLGYGVSLLPWSWGSPPYYFATATYPDSAATVFAVSINASASAVASLSRQSGVNRQSTNAAAATLSRQTSALLAASNSAAALLTRSTAKSAATVNAAVAALTVARNFLKGAQAQTAPVASRQASTSKGLQATTAAAASIRRDVAAIRQASTAAAASITRAVAHAVQASTAAVASAAAIKTKLQAAQASTSPVASIARAVSKGISASAAALGSVARSTAKTAQATDPAAASVQRSTAHAVQASTAAAATLGAIKTRLVSALAQTAPVASIQRATSKAMTVTMGPVASLARSTAKRALTTTVAVATILAGKSYARSIQAQATVAATLSRSTGKGVQASTAPLATIGRAITKTLRAAAAVVATLSKIATIIGGHITATPRPAGTNASARGAHTTATARTGHTPADPRTD